jgi:hypothetical protein
MNPTDTTSDKALTRAERRAALRDLLQRSGALERIDQLISPAGQPVEDDVLAEIGRRIASGELDEEEHA